MKNNKQLENIESEFNGDSKKIIKKILDEGIPSFSAEQGFKRTLDTKIQNKISNSNEQKKDQDLINSIPKKLKRRLYLTGYGYAVCSFLVLFLIGFCTNIFTGTLKIPSKYNYLKQNEAFGSLKPDIDDSGIGNSLTEGLSYGNIDYNNASNTITKSLVNNSASDKTQISLTEKFLTDYSNLDSSVYERDIFLDSGFVYDKTYRFTYKEKLFPKLNPEYPVYKSNGILMGNNTAEQLLKNFKVGDIQLGKFQNIEIKRIEINQEIKNGYYVEYDKDSFELNIYPNDTRQLKKYTEKLPSNKNILKNVEKDIKLLGISLKNYGDGVVDLNSFDENMGIINVLYPFKLQGKSLRDPELDTQIGMSVAYDLNLKKIISVTGIDIANYNVSNYTAQNKEIIESNIKQGGSYFKQGAIHKESTVVLFDDIDVVYIKKLGENGDLIYIPAIRCSVSTFLENYIGPSHIYQELI